MQNAARRPVSLLKNDIKEELNAGSPLIRTMQPSYDPLKTVVCDSEDVVIYRGKAISRKEYFKDIDPDFSDIPKLSPKNDPYRRGVWYTESDNSFRHTISELIRGLSISLLSATFMFMIPAMFAGRPFTKFIAGYWIISTIMMMIWCRYPKLFERSMRRSFGKQDNPFNSPAYKKNVRFLLLRTIHKQMKWFIAVNTIVVYIILITMTAV